MTRTLGKLSHYAGKHHTFLVALICRRQINACKDPSWPSSMPIHSQHVQVSFTSRRDEACSAVKNPMPSGDAVLARYNHYREKKGSLVAITSPHPWSCRRSEYYKTSCSLNLLVSPSPSFFPLRPRSVALSRLNSKGPPFFRTCCFAAAATAGLCWP